MQSEGRHINWIVYKSIDVYLFWLGFVWLMIVAFWKLIKGIGLAFGLGKISRNTKTKKQ